MDELRNEKTEIVGVYVDHDGEPQIAPDSTNTSCNLQVFFIVLTFLLNYYQT